MEGLVGLALGQKGLRELAGAKAPNPGPQKSFAQSLEASRLGGASGLGSWLEVLMQLTGAKAQNPGP